jgi:hypothetical protein
MIHKRIAIAFLASATLSTPILAQENPDPVLQQLADMYARAPLRGPATCRANRDGRSNNMAINCIPTLSGLNTEMIISSIRVNEGRCQHVLRTLDPAGRIVNDGADLPIILGRVDKPFTFNIIVRHCDLHDIDLGISIAKNDGSSLSVGTWNFHYYPDGVPEAIQKQGFTVNPHEGMVPHRVE